MGDIFFFPDCSRGNQDPDLINEKMIPFGKGACSNSRRRERAGHHEDQNVSQMRNSKRRENFCHLEITLEPDSGPAETRSDNGVLVLWQWHFLVAKAKVDFLPLAF